ncbi:helix-turn-helix domain-containing protein [Actinomadura sp. 9N215]|uniref:helix-turn-helix domain-containing protein n=1 Tax=Actinomadura sp. 9N215 TaxID=3375150 RepID=UPI0037BBCA72
MSQNRQRPVPESGCAQLLTIPETAARLRCSENTVYRLIASGDLPARDIGRGRVRTRVVEADLAAFIVGRPSVP